MGSTETVALELGPIRQTCGECGERKVMEKKERIRLAKRKKKTNTNMNRLWEIRNADWLANVINEEDEHTMDHINLNANTVFSAVRAVSVTSSGFRRVFTECGVAIESTR